MLEIKSTPMFTVIFLRLHHKHVLLFIVALFGVGLEKIFQTQFFIPYDLSSKGQKRNLSTIETMTINFTSDIFPSSFLFLFIFLI